MNKDSFEFLGDLDLVEKTPISRYDRSRGWRMRTNALHRRRDTQAEHLRTEVRKNRQRITGAERDNRNAYAQARFVAAAQEVKAGKASAAYYWTAEAAKRRAWYQCLAARRRYWSARESLEAAVYGWNAREEGPRFESNLSSNISASPEVMARLAGNIRAMQSSPAGTGVKSTFVLAFDPEIGSNPGTSAGRTGLLGRRGRVARAPA